MQPVLIYDNQSQNMSQISQSQAQQQPQQSKQLDIKSTQTTQKPQTKIIQVRSNQSSLQQPTQKIIKTQEIQGSMIFMQQCAQKYQLVGQSSQTTRQLIKQDHSQGQYQEEQEQYQAISQQEQEYEEQQRRYTYKDDKQIEKMQYKKDKQVERIYNYKNKQMIKKQQEKVPNQVIFLKANTDIFIKQIIPQNYQITCFLTIQKNVIGFQSKYRLFLAQQRQFLLSAKKQIFKYYSNFIISKHPSSINKRSNNYIGRIDANFIGTDFHLYASKGQQQNLSLKIQYKKNIAGFNGPRSFKAVKTNPKNHKTYNLKSLIQKRQQSKLIALSTIEPSMKKGKYRLDFKGKAKIASSKNFILSRQENNQPINCLIFGKVKQNQFLMEISYPLSIFQAFGICLSSLDSKILVN